MIGTLLGWLFGLGRLIARILRAVFDWVTSDWRNGPLLMLGILAAGHIFVIDPNLRDQRDTAIGQRNAERTAHRKTKTDYREAQAVAARLEEKRLARVKAEQQEITDAVEADYRRQLAGLHARAEQLRGQLRAGAGTAGEGRDIPVPGFPAAARGTAEASGDPGFPSAFVRSPAEQLERDVIATEQAIRLNALIDWLLAQSAIDPNAVEPQ